MRGGEELTLTSDVADHRHREVAQHGVALTGVDDGDGESARILPLSSVARTNGLAELEDGIDLFGRVERTGLVRVAIERERDRVAGTELIVGTRTGRRVSCEEADDLRSDSMRAHRR
jgi:hypothetical protein